MAKKRINSRKKGSGGELELAHYLTAKGFPARRGQQFSGLGESPDIVCETLDDWLIECKRVEGGNPYNWLDQAIRDAKLKRKPVVLHRRNSQPWIALLQIDDWLELVRPKT